MKAVFDTRPATKYDDDIGRRYHFPLRYLQQARECIDDWIIYREPRRGGGRQSYIAVAHLQRIGPAPNNPTHYYAHVSSFLHFDAVVPLARDGTYHEARLNEVPRSKVGPTLQGSAVRLISDGEFSAIAWGGLRRTFDADTADPADYETDADTHSFLSAAAEEQKRRIVEMLLNRKLRDAAFRKSVLQAYANRCAFTGLKVLDRAGRPETQAAHIWAVKDGGRMSYRTE
ncbi:MAG: HNH endonuclease [Gammaproteobacteria bacterium]|nr:HNH endonuclease [Gammaproteobacteria bacterium]